jgi:hypothetical protein
MAYLFVLSQLAGSVCGEFVDILYENKTWADWDKHNKFFNETEYNP